MGPLYKEIFQNLYFKSNLCWEPQVFYTLKQGAFGWFRIDIPTPAGVLQFNSCTNHPELAQIPQDMGAVSHKTALTSDASHISGGPQAACIYDQLVY